MPDIQAKMAAPSDFMPVGNQNPFPVEQYDQRYLAQGDSWASLGSLFVPVTTNLLLDSILSRSTVICSCARPGKVLEHMTDTMHDPLFMALLSDARRKLPWDALLISGGGNDLIDAANAKPDAPLGQRLLLTQPEWGVGSDPSRYLSTDGWNTFVSHMNKVFAGLLAQCDHAQHPTMPIVMHTYDYVTPRDAPAGPEMGPWLFKAMNSYAIPEEARVPLADLLIDKLAAMLANVPLIFPGHAIHVVDTRGTLQRAAVGSTGRSADWVNEIHPTADGYAKLRAKWRPILDGFPRLDPI